MRWIAGIVATGLVAASGAVAASGDDPRFFGASDVGRAAATETVDFTVFLPSRDQAGLDRLLQAQQDPASAQYHRWIGSAEYRARFGPDPDAVQKISAELRAAGFVVTPETMGVHAVGQAAAAERLFAVELHHTLARNGKERRVADRKLTLAADWQARGAQVFAFDPHVRHHALAQRASDSPANRDSSVGNYWFDDLKQAYKAPSYQVLTGAGRTIAILIDADVHDSDMQSYFGHEGIAPPVVNRVEVNGGTGFSVNGDSLEATLDIQQAYGMAPGATIYLYVVPNLDDASIMAGLNQILADGVADIVSMSFGGCERSYSKAYNNGVSQMSTLNQYHAIFDQGNAAGVTFVAASGDAGSLQCPNPAYYNNGPAPYYFEQGVSSPADDPDVTGVGGTNLVTNDAPPSLDSSYAVENAEPDEQQPYDPDGMGKNVSGGVFASGGGWSIHFVAPSWQSYVYTGIGQRTTPDVSLHMGGCPQDTVGQCGPDRSGDYIWFNGSLQSVIGTSAATPGFAGVVALMDQYQSNRVGNVNPQMYALAYSQAHGGKRFFHQAIGGNNGLFTSNADGSLPYNMVVGNGTLNIHHFIGAITAPVAGIPQTPSNP
jgi:subtilase family serine protease